MPDAEGSLVCDRQQRASAPRSSFMSRPTPKRVLPARGSKGRRPDLSVGGGGAFHTPHGPDGGSSLLESEHGSGSLPEAQLRRLEQAAHDAFEREERGSDDGSDVSDDVPNGGKPLYSNIFLFSFSE